MAEGLAVWFMGGDSEGTGPCPAYLGGDCWDVTSPRFMQVAWTDDEGIATWNVDLAYYPSITVGATRSFQAAANTPEGVPTSYKRYLENRLRDAYGFKGTPIRISFRQKRRPGEGKSR